MSPARPRLPAHFPVDATLRIRMGTPTDVASVTDLVKRAYAHYVVRIGRPPGPMSDDYAVKVAQGQVWVVEGAGSVVGLIVLVGEADHLLVENIAVDPGRQGHGIGRTLMAFAEDTARAAGLSRLRLYTNAAMTENLAFYPRLGFEEVGRRAECGYERVFFVKHLN